MENSESVTKVTEQTPSDKSDSELIGILTKRVNDLEKQASELDVACILLIDAIEASKSIDSRRACILESAGMALDGEFTLDELVELVKSK